MAASILIRATEAEREAIKAAAARVGQPVARWALGILLQAAVPPGPAVAAAAHATPPAKLSTARAALLAGERKAAPLARRAPSNDAAPAVAARCSPHKRLACPSCAP